MKNAMKRGFTLIELLVVIAIIGILAAVVLGSLNDARDNANDASAKTSMNNMRNAAEIFYTQNDFTYGNANVTFEDATGLPNAAVNTTNFCRLQSTIDLMAAVNDQTGNDVRCFGGGEEYAVAGELRNEQFFCVDSSGFSGEVGTADDTIADADMICG